MSCGSSKTAIYDLVERPFGAHRSQHQARGERAILGREARAVDGGVYHVAGEGLALPDDAHRLERRQARRRRLRAGELEALRLAARASRVAKAPFRRTAIARGALLVEGALLVGGALLAKGALLALAEAAVPGVAGALLAAAEAPAVLKALIPPVVAASVEALALLRAPLPPVVATGSEAPLAVATVVEALRPIAARIEAAPLAAVAALPVTRAALCAALAVSAVAPVVAAAAELAPAARGRPSPAARATLPRPSAIVPLALARPAVLLRHARSSTSIRSASIPALPRQTIWRPWPACRRA